MPLCAHNASPLLPSPGTRSRWGRGTRAQCGARHTGPRSLTLAPIWLPHWPACRCTISLMAAAAAAAGAAAEERAERKPKCGSAESYNRRCAGAYIPAAPAPASLLLGVQSEAGRRPRLIGCNPVNRAAQGPPSRRRSPFIGPSRPLHSLSKSPPLALRSSDHWLFQMIDLCSHWLAPQSTPTAFRYWLAGRASW